MASLGPSLAMLVDGLSLGNGNVLGPSLTVERASLGDAFASLVNGNLLEEQHFKTSNKSNIGTSFFASMGNSVFAFN